MANRRNLAVAGGADADALDGRGAVDGVVRDQGPGHRNANRSVGRAGAECGQQRIGPQKELGAEAAADEGRAQADFLRRDAQGLRDVSCSPGDHLIGRPDRQLVAVPRGDAGERLDHRVRFVGSGVVRVELHRSAGEGAGEVSDRGLRSHSGAFRRLACILDGREVVISLRSCVIHPHQMGRCARLFEGLRHHQRDRLVVVLDLGAAQEMGAVELSFAELAGILCCHDGQHARCGAYRREVHGDNAALGNGGPHDVPVRLVGDHVVPVLRIGRGAGRLERAVDAVDRLADDLELIDRIGGGGSVEFHGLSLGFCQHGGESALHQRHLVCVVVGGARAGKERR